MGPIKAALGGLIWLTDCHKEFYLSVDSPSSVPHGVHRELNGGSLVLHSPSIPLGHCGPARMISPSKLISQTVVKLNTSFSSLSLIFAVLLSVSRNLQNIDPSLVSYFKLPNRIVGLRRSSDHNCIKHVKSICLQLTLLCN